LEFDTRNNNEFRHLFQSVGSWCNFSFCHFFPYLRSFFQLPDPRAQLSPEYPVVFPHDFQRLIHGQGFRFHISFPAGGPGGKKGIDDSFFGRFDYRFEQKIEMVVPEYPVQFGYLITIPLSLR
jgi:hypothetical protein